MKEKILNLNEIVDGIVSTAKKKIDVYIEEKRKELAEDILGYNRCFSHGHMDNEINRKLRYHIKRCEKLLNEMEK